MNAFDYFAPKTIQLACALMREYGRDARLLAGGTDLLVRIKTGRFTPRAVIDLKGIPELNPGIHACAGEVRIGALTTMGALTADPLVRAHFPALAEAAATVGSVQIRNRATLAGNICNASPAADTATPLLIYRARVVLLSDTSERQVPLGAFLTGPGRTVLAEGELAAAIVLPFPEKNQAAAFERLTRRKGVDLATINLCCQVTEAGLTRFALGAVGPVPFVVEEGEGILASSSASAEAKKACITQLMARAMPISDVRASKEYRQAMLTVLGQRALARALERLQAQSQDMRL